jgi:hypothetical protein
MDTDGFLLPHEAEQEGVRLMVMQKPASRETETGESVYTANCKFAIVTVCSRLLPSSLTCVRPIADSTKHEQSKGWQSGLRLHNQQTLKLVTIVL